MKTSSAEAENCEDTVIAASGDMLNENTMEEEIIDDKSSKWSHLEKLTDENIFSEIDVQQSQTSSDVNKSKDVKTNNITVTSEEQQILMSELLLDKIFEPSTIVEHLSMNEIEKYIHILTRRLTTLQSLLKHRQRQKGIDDKESTYFKASDEFLKIFDVNKDDARPQSGHDMVNCEKYIESQGSVDDVQSTNEDEKNDDIQSNDEDEKKADKEGTVHDSTSSNEDDSNEENEGVLDDIPSGKEDAKHDESQESLDDIPSNHDDEQCHAGLGGVQCMINTNSDENGNERTEERSDIHNIERRGQKSKLLTMT